MMIPYPDNFPSQALFFMLEERLRTLDPRIKSLKSVFKDPRKRQKWNCCS